MLGQKKSVSSKNVVVQKLYRPKQILGPKIGVATIVQETIVQGDNCPRDFCPRDSCPRRLLSKEAFTSEKLAQIIFSHFLLEVTTFIDHRI